MIRVGTVFEPLSEPKFLALEYRGGTLARYLPRVLPEATGVWRNGRPVELLATRTMAARDGDEILFAPLPGIVVAGPIAAGLAGSAGLAAGTKGSIFAGFSLGGFAASLAIGIGSSLLSYFLAPRPRISETRQEDPEIILGAQSTTGEGVAVPLLYGGPIRAGGHIVSSFQRALHYVSPSTYAPSGSGAQNARFVSTAFNADIRPYLHTKAVYGMGPVESISDQKIDLNDVSVLAGVEIQTRLGTPYQEPVYGLGEEYLTQSIGYNFPRTTANTTRTETTSIACDAVELTLRFPSGLGKIGDSRIKYRELDMKFEYREKGETTWTVFTTATLTGKTTAIFDVNVRLPRFTRRTVHEIRVTRVDAWDSDPAKLDDVYWHEMREVTDVESVHPGVAYDGFIQAPQAQLQDFNFQNYTALVEGFSDCRVYAGDGTYTTGYSNNPAWCALHFLTSQHGLGQWYSHADVDLVSFVYWADYCDELVDDGTGTGGLQARCRFAWQFRNVRNGYEFLKAFAQSAGATIHRINNRWSVHVDEPAPPLARLDFTEGGIIDTATLSFIPPRERVTRVKVSFLNADKDYEPDHLEDFDDDAVGDDEGLTLEVDMIGVTRVAQVAREARRIINHAKYSDTAIAFTAGPQALPLRVGAPFRAMVRTVDPAAQVASGAVVEVAAAEFRIDADVPFESGKSYIARVVHQLDGHAEAKVLQNPEEDSDVLVPETWRWSRELRGGDRCAVWEASYTPAEWICTHRDVQPDMTVAVRGIRYQAAAYDLGELRVPGTLVEGDRSDPRQMPPLPTDLDAEALSDHGRIALSWRAGTGSTPAAWYRVWARETAPSDQKEFRIAGSSEETTFLWDWGDRNTSYRLMVQPVSAAGAAPSPEDCPTVDVTIGDTPTWWM